MPAQPQSAWQSFLSILPQTSGLMKASQALSLAQGQQQPQQADLAAKLAKLKADGPKNYGDWKNWHDQVASLEDQLKGGAPAAH